MNIAVYHPWIYLRGGIERTLVELVKRSRHQWSIFTNHYEPENTFEALRHFNVTQLKPISVKRTIPAVLSAGVRLVLQKLSLEGYDALVILCDGLGDFLTFRHRSVPIFTICFTPLRAAFDPVYETFAYSQRSFKGRVAYKLFKAAFRRVDPLAWHRYDGVIAISHEVKRRIIGGGLYEDGPRIRVCYPGIDWQALKGDVTYEPIILVPGRIVWTKNIELTIKAFKQAHLPFPWRLVVAGFLDRKSYPYLERLMEIVGKEEKITFVISPDDAQLGDLYRRTSLVCFPPLNEDWGLVPLEAMAFRKAVIANARGGPLESILHGKTGLLLEPKVETWAEAIRYLVENPHLVRMMGECGRQHVGKFDWSQFVNQVDSALEEWTA